MPKRRPTTRNRDGNLPRERDRERGTAAARGYDARHRRWRKMVLARNPLCLNCVDHGKVTPATEADHIIPLRDGGDWSLDNGQGLCKSCHSRKTNREKQR